MGLLRLTFVFIMGFSINEAAYKRTDKNVRQGIII